VALRGALRTLAVEQPAAERTVALLELFAEV
jgi:hypothetical protein